MLSQEEIDFAALAVLADELAQPYDADWVIKERGPRGPLQFGVDMEVGDRNISIENYRQRYLRPAMARIANEILHREMADFKDELLVAPPPSWGEPRVIRGGKFPIIAMQTRENLGDGYFIVATGWENKINGSQNH